MWLDTEYLPTVHLQLRFQKPASPHIPTRSDTPPPAIFETRESLYSHPRAIARFLPSTVPTLLYTPNPTASSPGPTVRCGCPHDLAHRADHLPLAFQLPLPIVPEISNLRTALFHALLQTTTMNRPSLDWHLLFFLHRTVSRRRTFFVFHTLYSWSLVHPFHDTFRLCDITQLSTLL